MPPTKPLLHLAAIEQGENGLLKKHNLLHSHRQQIKQALLFALNLDLDPQQRD